MPLHSAASVRQRCGSLLLVAVSASLLAATGREVGAIEMFTFYGDGSRIGLPSLEVPIEAYPGIPLRSDRLRARRRAQAAAAASSAANAAHGPGPGMTIRAMPTPEGAIRSAPATGRRRWPQQDGIPVAPEPEEVLALPAR